jgi:hypothetical protein
MSLHSSKWSNLVLADGLASTEAGEQRCTSMTLYNAQLLFRVTCSIILLPASNDINIYTASVYFQTSIELC